MNSKPIAFSGVILAALLMISAPDLCASPIQAGDYFTVWTTAYRTGSGGPFLIKPVAPFYNPVTGVTYDGTFDPFPAFCVQENEHISLSTSTPGTLFYVRAITDYATVESDAPGGRDPISDQTAWIYRTYLDGNLAALGIAGLTPTQQGVAVQHAIWCLESEYGSGSSVCTTTGVQTVITKAAVSTGLYGVGVLNVMNTVRNSYQENGITKYYWIPGTTNSQDQLAPVPEPGALTLFGSGMLTLAAAVRRRKRQ